jgi:predicted nuclease of predicted toxin-antitoxin system
VRLLLDNNLSPQVVGLLADAGHEVEHVRDHDLRAAADEDVLAFAREHHLTLVSADTDFGQLLQHSRAGAPSVVLIRSANNRRPTAQARLLLDNLPAVEADLATGALVVFEDTRIRVRELPFGT